MTSLLFVSHNFAPQRGGIERLVDGLAAHTDPSGTVVLAPPAPGADAHDRAAPYTVRRVTLVGDRPPRWWPTRTAVASALRAERPRVVVSAEWWPEARAMATIRHRGTHVVLAHGSEVTVAERHPPTRARMVRSFRRADLVVANSRFTATRLAALGIESAVCEPGVAIDPPVEEPTAVAAELGLTGRPVVLTVARLVPRKGHLGFLERWPDVVRRVPGAVWVVVGDGPLRDRLDHPGGSVVRVGEIDDRRLAALFRIADVHVMPGVEVAGEVEGFGMAAVEAGAARTPTVATDLGGVAEAVGDGGVVVGGGDVPALADAVVDLLLDDRRRTDLGDSARRRAEALAWPVVAARFARCVGLAEGGGPGA